MTTALAFALASVAAASAARAQGMQSMQGAPCVSPAAVTLADRPGTGRTTSTGGAPCVVLPGEIVVESGWRRQITDDPSGAITLGSGPLALVRVGVVKRLEIAFAPPAPQSRLATGIAPAGTARGTSDPVVALKYLVLDRDVTQASVGLAYAPPLGTGGFSNGLPTYALSLNAGTVLSPRVSVATSLVASTAAGADALGATRAYFVFAPSVTLAYALDGMDTLLVQDALVSRQGPVLPAGSRAFVAFQRAIGTRIAVDLDYEQNLTPLLGTRAHALGAGIVWIAAPARR
ncbi:MAG TPA: hypothetical protein VHT53_05995 [Candidatus Elarobacter sp.]|nr:hypothetical protein [Candidatus Elarobacter sp.]